MNAIEIGFQEYLDRLSKAASYGLKGIELQGKRTVTNKEWRKHVQVTSIIYYCNCIKLKLYLQSKDFHLNILINNLVNKSLPEIPLGSKVFTAKF